MGSHAKYAPSSAHRWLKCAGSILMSELYPQGESSEYAKEGTRAHAAAEVMLNLIINKARTLEEAWCMTHPSIFDNDEMRGYVLAYVRTALDLLLPARDILRVGIEEKLQLADGIGGTLDFAALEETLTGEKVGIILDLKYGAGHAVEVEGNAQLACYACCMNKEWGPLAGVSVYIYQPRVEHEAGPYRRAYFSAADIEAWSESFIAARDMIEAQLASGTMSYCAGEHCRWCPGEAVCETRRKFFMTDAAADFLPIEKPLLEPDVLTPDVMAKLILHRPEIESYLKRVDEFVKTQLLAGHAYPELKLVAGRTVRRWAGDVGEQLKELGVAEPYRKELRGITEIEKEIGKGKIDDLTVKPEPSVKVAHVTDKRPAINPAAIDFEF